MITVKDFIQKYNEEKNNTVKSFVESCLSELLQRVLTDSTILMITIHPSHKFIKRDYYFCEKVVEELKSRGFVDINVNYPERFDSEYPFYQEIEIRFNVPIEEK